MKVGNKKILFAGLLFFMSFLIVNSVSGAGTMTTSNVTINLPYTSQVVAGIATVGIDIDNFPTENYTMATFYGKSALSANTTWTLLNKTMNKTALAFNSSFASTILEDANDYQFLANISNGSAVITMSPITGIVIDNTNPTTPSALSPTSLSSITSTGTQTFSATVTDAETVSCTYVISRGGPDSSDSKTSTSATYSGSSCSFTKDFTSSVQNGEWWYYITASDGSNTTDSAKTKIFVSIPGNTGGYVTDTDGDGIIDAFDTTNNNLWAILIIVAIIGGLIYFFKKK